MINIGEHAPDFALKDQTGELRTLDSFIAQGDLLLYFYPADFTPICSAEACNFRDTFGELDQLNLNLVGISPQDVASHQKFAAFYALPFPLLADENKHTIRAYGVDGPMGFGVRRATFLINSAKTVVNRVVSDIFLGSHLDLLNQTVQGRKR